MELLTIIFAVLAATLGFGGESRAAALSAGVPAQSVSVQSAPCAVASDVAAPVLITHWPSADAVVPRSLAMFLAPDMALVPVRLLFGVRRE